MRKIIVILFLMVCNENRINSQCSGPSPTPSAPCTGTLLTDGANVNSGSEYYYDGGPVVFNSVSINGGLLRVCGTLNIVNLNFNGGRLVIEPTGSLTFGQSVSSYLSPQQLITNYGSLTIGQNYNINTDSYLINYGTININTTTVLAGTNAFLVNELQGIINMNAFDATLNSGFINRGEAVFRNLSINAAGYVCMANGSSLSVNDIASNPLNSFTVESGTACLSYSGQALLNASLTASSGLYICRLPGSQDPSPSNFGSAQVVNPCTSCQVVLPVDLLSFSVTLEGTQCQLQWSTATEDNVRSFIVEKSQDGQHFSSIGQVPANNRPSTYSYNTVISDKTFFRLKIVDIDGRYVYSGINSVDPEINSFRLSVFPNPVTNGFAEYSISSPGLENGEIILIDMNGKIIYQQSLQMQRGIFRYRIPVHQLSPGIYQLNFKNSKTLAKAKFVIASK